MRSLFIVAEFVLYLIGFGLAYYFIRRLACKNIRDTFGWNGLMLFSFIGTPLHELGHFITCVIFGHNVTSVALFAPIKGKQTGEIGYVIHNYNKKSLYQKTGNFFIGIAPMIFGIGAILLLTQWFYPEYIASVIPKATGTIDFLFFKNIFMNIVLNSTQIFNLQNLLTIQFWLYLFIVVNIALNMSISLIDLKNCFTGIVQLFIVSIIAILLIVGYALDVETFISILSTGLYYMVFGLFLGIIILLSITVVSYFFVFIKKLIKK